MLFPMGEARTSFNRGTQGVRGTAYGVRGPLGVGMEGAITMIDYCAHCPADTDGSNAWMYMSCVPMQT